MEKVRFWDFNDDIATVLTEEWYPLDMAIKSHDWNVDAMQARFSLGTTHEYRPFDYKKEIQW